MNYTNKYNFGDTSHAWNPWRGCFQISEACQHCYISELNSFSYIYSPLPNSFKQLPTGTKILVSLKSDFFLKKLEKAILSLIEKGVDTFIAVWRLVLTPKRRKSFFLSRRSTNT
jgi:hypothetical protein